MKFILWTLLVSIIFAPASWAYDFATESTQIMNNIELVGENLRMLQSLQNEIEMIKNQIEQLKSIATYKDNLGEADTLRNQLTDITNQGTVLSDQTQAILTNMQQQLINLPANTAMTDQDEATIQGAMTIVQNALNRVKQLRQSYPQVTSSVNGLMDKNNQSIGQTQALQTANELAAVNIAQTQTTHELLSEQISVIGAVLNKQFAQEAQEDEEMKQIFNVTDNSGITSSESLQ